MADKDEELATPKKKKNSLAKRIVENVLATPGAVGSVASKIVEAEKKRKSAGAAKPWYEKRTDKWKADRLKKAKEDELARP